MQARGIIVAAAVLLAGCRGGSPSDVPREAPAGSPVSPAARGEWVAVFAVGAPNDLEDESAVIEERAAESIAVAPVSCWAELAEALDIETDAYVAAVTAISPAELERAVARVGLEVIFRGQFEGRCVD